MIKTLSLCLSFVFLFASCASLKDDADRGRKHSLERKWAVSNLKGDYLGFRVRHGMTPLIFNDLIIQGNSVDGIAAYKISSGQLIWRKDVKGGVEGGAVVSDGTLYFGAGDSMFYALNANNGRLKWTFPLRFEGLSAPTIQAGTVYVTTGSDTVYALHAKSGEQKWIYKRRVPSNFSIRGNSRPSISGNRLYVGFSDGYIVALNKNTGNLSWEKSINANRRFKDVDSEAIVDGKHLYVSGYDENLYCLKKSNGAVVWSAEYGGGTAVSLSKDKVFVASSKNYIVALDKKSGKKLWKIKTKGLPTGPVPHKGALIFGESKGNLRLIDQRTGEDFDQFWPGRGVSSTPLVDPKTGDIYFLSVDANLFALKRSWKSVSDFWPWE